MPETYEIKQNQPSKVDSAVKTGMGAILAGIGAWFASSPGSRAGVAHRILNEKTFAETFHDGKFLNLHTSLNPEYVRSSTGFVDFFKNFKNQWNIQGKVTAALKEEKLSFGTLWKAESFGQKIIGGGFAAVGVLLGVATIYSGIKGLLKKSSPDTVIIKADEPQRIATQTSPSVEETQAQLNDDRKHVDRLQKNSATVGQAL